MELPVIKSGKSNDNWCVMSPVNGRKVKKWEANKETTIKIGGIMRESNVFFKYSFGSGEKNKKTCFSYCFGNNERQLEFPPLF